jgi:hypothetical protein
MRQFCDSQLNVYFVSSYALISGVLQNSKICLSEMDPLVMTIFGNEADVKNSMKKNSGGCRPDSVDSDPPGHRKISAIVEQSITLSIVKKMALPV